MRTENHRIHGPRFCLKLTSPLPFPYRGKLAITLIQLSSDIILTLPSVVPTGCTCGKYTKGQEPEVFSILKNKNFKEAPGWLSQ